MKHLLTRRTIRKYTQEPVSDELLNRLMNEAARTQTMGNLQLYSVVVTRSDDMKAKLAPDPKRRHESQAGTCPFQPAHGETGACGAYHLCRF